jgi:MFS family permease
VDTDLRVIIGVFGAVGGLLVLALIALALKANWRRVGLLLGVTAVIAFIVSGAVYFPFPMLIVVGVALLLATLATVLRVDWVDDQSRRIWNPRKAFGGAIFGDVANTIGVVAGMGASRLFAPAAWWWLGQVGALLALMVGLSLLWRGFMEKKRLKTLHQSLDNAPADKKKEAASRKWFGLLNLIVGFATWLSLMLITTSNASEVQRGDIRVLWFIYALLFLVFLIFITVYYGRANLPADGWDRFMLVVFWLLFVALVIMAALINFRLDLFPQSFTTATVGAVVGLVGVLAWIIAEGANWGLLSFQFYEDQIIAVKALDYLVWEKNLWQVIGGLTTMIFLSAVLADGVNSRPESAGLQSQDAIRIIFIVGATLSLIGALRGILSGILNRFQA